MVLYYLLLTFTSPFIPSPLPTIQSIFMFRIWWMGKVYWGHFAYDGYLNITGKKSACCQVSHIAHWICHPHVKPIWEVKWLKKFYNMWVKSYGCNLIFFFAKNVVLPTIEKGYKCVWVISWEFIIHYVRYECMMYIKSLKALINRRSKMPWKVYWPRWFTLVTTI